MKWPLACVASFLAALALGYYAWHDPFSRFLWSPTRGVCTLENRIDSMAIRTVPNGTPCRVLKRAGDDVLVETRNGQSGWVRTDDVITASEIDARLKVDLANDKEIRENVASRLAETERAVKTRRAEIDAHDPTLTH